MKTIYEKSLADDTYCYAVVAKSLMNCEMKKVIFTMINIFT